MQVVSHSHVLHRRVLLISYRVLVARLGLLLSRSGRRWDPVHVEGLWLRSEVARLLNVDSLVALGLVAATFPELVLNLQVRAHACASRSAHFGLGAADLTQEAVGQCALPFGRDPTQECKS